MDLGGYKTRGRMNLPGLGWSQPMSARDPRRGGIRTWRQGVQVMVDQGRKAREMDNRDI